MNPEDVHKSAIGPQSDQEALKSDLADTMAASRSTSSDAAGAEPTAGAEAWIGKTLGKYQITSVLGCGAMGVVLKARDQVIERDVAVKVLADHLAADATALGRFLSEARAAGQINHPNVVAIYEICQENALTYLVLEYAPGGNLEEWLTERRTLPVLEATQALIEACKGVGAAHAANLIHRDIKPANFMRTADGSIKVADFGLAKALGRSGRELTQVGTVVGTPYFMSPEQCEAKPLDKRSDVYSLGATYYSLLTGKSPFHDSETVPQVMYAHCHGPLPDPRSLNPAIPPACAHIIAKAMAKAPNDRYPSTVEMLADLQAVAAALSGQTHISLPSDSGNVPAKDAGASTLKQHSYGLRFRLGAAAVGIFFLAGAVVGWLVWGGRVLPSGSTAGGREPPAAESAAALTATAPGVTASEITLGMSAPFSGPAKELGRGMQIGIETYLDYVNETAGGVHGRKLKLLALDDGYEPDRCLATMKDMIDQRPVFAFTGNVGTPTAEVALPVALQHKRIFFGAFTGAALLRHDPPDRYVFNYRASYAEETAAIVQYLLTIRRIKPEEIAVFAQQDRYGDAGFSGVAKALRKVGLDPAQIVRVGYARNSMNLDAAVSGLLKHKDQIKAVVMVPTYRQAAAFIQRVVDGGMQPIFTSVSFVGSNALAEALKELGPKYANGVIVTQVVPFFGSGATGVLEYRERLAHYFPAEQPGFVSLEGYIVARVLCEALEKVGPDVTTEKLVDALESIQGVDFGIGTKISFGPSEHQGSHKVWAATLDVQGEFRSLDLD
jgi:serine/threonine protein kinase/ABC-type branched-subunit amino acid transport system substrate-binding protein